MTARTFHACAQPKCGASLQLGALCVDCCAGVRCGRCGRCRRCSGDAVRARLFPNPKKKPKKT